MKVRDKFDKSWTRIFSLLYQEPLNTLNNDILPNISYSPHKDDIFNAFRIPLEKINVVILGDEPYLAPKLCDGKAYAMSTFAVDNQISMPLVLKTIKKEIDQESNLLKVNNGDKWKTLKHLEDQGVFLLNTALTVQKGLPGSHYKYWQQFTERVIREVSLNNPCIWVLWGKNAQKYSRFIDNSFFVEGYDKSNIAKMPMSKYKNYVLEAPHPALENNNNNIGFLGCNHFLFINTILRATKHREIAW